jgi:ubiquinol oxidase
MEPQTVFKHDPVFLQTEQQKTLASQRLNYGFFARLLFLWMDLVYGKKRTLSKFKVLEVIARVPYQAWEHVSYIAMTHTYSRPHFARRVFDFVKESRHQQDNEQWHLLILEEMIQKKGILENFFMFRIVPQFMAFLYYHLSWLLYVMKPAWSYGLNADFEDHAEHEYMEFVRENLAFETELFESDFKADYGDFSNVADLFRRIGLDERLHKEESLDRIKNPRFA